MRRRGRRGERRGTGDGDRGIKRRERSGQSIPRSVRSLPFVNCHADSERGRGLDSELLFQSQKTSNQQKTRNKKPETKNQKTKKIRLLSEIILVQGPRPPSPLGNKRVRTGANRQGGSSTSRVWPLIAFYGISFFGKLERCWRFRRGARDG